MVGFLIWLEGNSPEGHVFWAMSIWLKRLLLLSRFLYASTHRSTCLGSGLYSICKGTILPRLLARTFVSGKNILGKKIREVGQGCFFHLRQRDKKRG
jgi:hypothetical protein